MEGDQTRAIFSVTWSADDVIASASGDNSICLYSPSPAVATGSEAAAASSPQGWQLTGKQVPLRNSSEGNRYTYLAAHREIGAPIR